VNTFTISIDRTSLSESPLVLSGTAGTTAALGVSNYQEPGMLPRVSYAPQSDFVHGDLALGWTWQQTVLNFTVFATAAPTEQSNRDSITELVQAVTQFPSFEVTVTVDDSAPETFYCDPGSVTPLNSRTVYDVLLHNPEWAVSIPAFPVRSVA
jgi:hypothetical protein